MRAAALHRARRAESFEGDLELEDRRTAERVGPLVRWAELTIAAVPVPSKPSTDDARFAQFATNRPDSIIDRHARQHLEWTSGTPSACRFGGRLTRASCADRPDHVRVRSTRSSPRARTTISTHRVKAEIPAVVVRKIYRGGTCPAWCATAPDASSPAATTSRPSWPTCATARKLRSAEPSPASSIADLREIPRSRCAHAHLRRLEILTDAQHSHAD